MSTTAQLHLDQRPQVPLTLVPRTDRSAAARLASFVLHAWNLGLMVGDTAVVLTGFFLAYWVRFVIPDAEALALGIDEYLRVGLTVAVLTVLLLMSHGLYDADRPATWPMR